jgi:hypothetical protein
MAPLLPETIGLKIATPIMVPSKRGAWGKIPIAALFDDPNVDRVSKSGANRTTWEYDETTYSCKTRAHEELASTEDTNFFGRYFDFETTLAGRGQGIILRKQEKRIATLCQNTSTFTGASGTLSVSVKWNVAATATPVTDVSTGLVKIRAKCGIIADTLQIGFQTWRDLSACTQIRGSMAYTQMPNGFIPLDSLASALGVQRVLVPGSANLYNSAKSGQTASLSEIWDSQYAFLCVTSQSPDPSAPCVARTLCWEGGGGALAVDTYREEQTESDVYRVKQCCDEQIVDSAYGFLFSNLV